MGQSNPKGPSFQHLALMVRDIEASHRFYTEVVGLEQCAKIEPSTVPDVDFRFYRGATDRHHDLALVQIPDPSVFPPAPGSWEMIENKTGINHFAICYPTREEFLERLANARRLGVTFHQRGNHGMTHSVYVSDPDGNGVELLYELPEEVWVGDVHAALNYWQEMPVDGDEALTDDINYPRFEAAGT